MAKAKSTSSHENIAAAIEQLVDEIRDCKSNMDEIEACVADLKDQLHQKLEAYGKNWRDDRGYARLVAEGERTYYNS